ncbi:hypothetical protein [Jannaschia ovalis]|uniref:Uncharacterized protein n=1 Tax=Jannaschia ovalis TaxID=3038773 RepID=A0ABY8LDW1_9RHOB|nr:hypothetical protein [Jannaschia sp. GRR-S6-38]WGH79511.1 hypothetical protein P8627_04395 [Jannaschia sp. GRR-S6-38]
MRPDIEKTLAAIPQMDADRIARLRARAEEWADSDDPDRQEAGRAVGEAIDSHTVDATEAESSRLDRLAETGLEPRVAVAFGTLPPTDGESLILRAVLNRPGESPRDLSAAIGAKDQAWRTRFETMCERRKEWLGAPPASDAEGDSPSWAALMCDFGPEDATVTMKPEAASALARLGIRARA